MSAFYDDYGDGIELCYWCLGEAVDEWCGLPLCQEHYWIEASRPITHDHH